MQLGWIDFSKEDREKILDVINLLQEDGAVDELGIGVIRDAFSNYFFPGTSTVQTRAKYLLIVPYILKEAADGLYGNDVSQILKRIDIEEKNCGLLFMKNCPNEDGIIGKRVLPKGWVSRKPSNIYWNGIRTLGIFSDNSISISDYISLSNTIRKQKKNQVNLGNRNDSNEDNESDDIDAVGTQMIPYFTLPGTYKTDWRENLTIQLNVDEAVFLRKQILKSIPDTLFAYLLKENIDIGRYENFEALYMELKNKVSDEMENIMHLACNFNRLVYVARIRYNLMLSDFQNEEALEEWKIYKKKLNEVADVDLEQIYEKLDIRNYGVKKFLNQLRDALLANDIDGIDRIVRNREKDIKGANRAKLNHVGDYDYQSWIGGRWLDFRFFDACKIIKDIYQGEEITDV